MHVRFPIGWLAFTPARISAWKNAIASENRQKMELRITILHADEEEHAMSQVKLHFTSSRMPTPIGEMRLITDERDIVRALDWDDHTDRMLRLLMRQYGPDRVQLADGPMPRHLRALLDAYFAGDLHAIDDIAVETAGTPFQRDVWAALRLIPAGQTFSYSAQAVKIGRPAAVRAVGLANGANPVGLIVPCHRVIGADGSLTGYGGGIERKRWLLRHEGARFKDATAQAELSLPL
jgi:methylated-DNA-[protein]-cysteine S-methyltransferase